MRLWSGSKWLAAVTLCGILAVLALIRAEALAAELTPEQQKAAAEQQKNIAAVEAVLPKYEQAADACEKALAPLMDSKDPNVIAAVDGALLRIVAIRHVRAMIAEKPSIFASPTIQQKLDPWKEALDYFLDCARSKKDPYEGMTSGVRAFRSPTDGHIDFYVFKLPDDFDPKRKYPLDIDLHYGAALVWEGLWIDGKPSNDRRRANRADRIYISPDGRGNNSYEGMGSAAAVDAVKHAMKHYPVDRERVFMGGGSMGAAGSARLASLYPDMFTAIHLLTGNPNYQGIAGDGRFDPLVLIENFANVAVCSLEATGDRGHSVPQGKLVEGMKELSLKHQGYYDTFRYIDPAGGHGQVDSRMQAQGMEWTYSRKRTLYPKLVVYKTYSLRYDGAYWGYIDMTGSSSVPARIEAEFTSPDKVTVTVENVTRFHLDLVKELVGDAKELAVSVNGTPAVKAPAGGTVYFAEKDGKWGRSAERYPKGLIKKHGLSGLVLDVFMENPVLMVYGTLESKDAKRGGQIVDNAVLQMFGACDGGDTLHTMFERKADSAVTKEDIAGKNLVLFGTPGQNAVLRSIADKLPVRWLEDGVEIAGKAHRGDRVGIVLVYPNPLNPDRYVLLMPENYHWLDLRTLRDYAVTRPLDQRSVRLKVVEQGDFDSHWGIPAGKQ